MTDFFCHKTILLPFDFSETAAEAVEEVRRMVDESTRVCMLNVLVPMYAVAVEPGMIMDLGSDDDRIANAIQGMKDRFDGTKLKIEFAARIGDPGSEIVDYANEIEADMIVMPSHGRTGLKRMLLGSVAERVIRLAGCPVMVLRKAKHH